MSFFSDRESIESYAERPIRQVPGFESLQKMTTLLLAERAPADGRVLVLGAGGGLELKVFAEAMPNWKFDGVDPSAPMLALARKTLGVLATRVNFHEGYVDCAPVGPFDGATCLLTLHFLTIEERMHTLKQLLLRLKPGAPLVVAHHSFAQNSAEQMKWLKRYASFAISSGISAEDAQQTIGAMATHLSLLAPGQDEELLMEAGFAGVEMFYAGFTFRGWVAYRPE